MNGRIKKFIWFFACATLVLSFWQISVFAQDSRLVTEVVNEELDAYDQRRLLTENLITIFEYTNNDIKEVLDDLAKKGGTRINYEADLSGSVTVYLRDVRFEDALRIICNLQDLAYLKEKGIDGITEFKIISDSDYALKKGRSFSELIDSKIFILKHANVTDIEEVLAEILSEVGIVIIDESFDAVTVIEQKEKLDDITAMIEELDVTLSTEIFTLDPKVFIEIEEKINALLTKDVGQLQFDERSGNMIVTDTENKIQDIRSIVNQYNLKDRTFDVNVKIYQITLSDEHQQGVDWEAIVSDFETIEFIDRQENPRSLSLGTLNDEDFVVLVDALDTVGVVKQISNDNIRTKTGKKENVVVDNEHLWKSENIKKLRRPIVNKQPFSFQYAVELTDPKTMQLTLSTSPNNSKILSLNDKSTFIVGGLFIKKIVESSWKIPLLGDLPFLGIAFRSEGQVNRKTEVMLFITPTIKVNGEE